MSEVRYAVHQKVHVAFREIVGDPSSDVTILFLSGQLIPIEMMWKDHLHARFVDALAGLGRLIVFDRRGIGMSDPITDWDEPVVEQWVQDAISVLDTVGAEKTIVVGWEMGGGLGFRLAVERPDRVSKLVVLHGLDRSERLESSSLATPEELAADMTKLIEGEADDGLSLGSPYDYAPTRTGDISVLNWLDQAGRLGASPMMASRIWNSVFTESTDVDLALLECQTLVLWRRENLVIRVAAGRAISEEYPDIEYVELPGQDFAPYGGDVDGLTREIERFVTGSVRRAEAEDRRLSAMLFSDIVGSTESAALVGDAAWRGTLDAHDRIVDRVVSRHGGTVVKQTGDGVLAVFDLASRAVRTACELRDELVSIGLTIRQGLHAGEISIRGDDVSGVAVHLAARVMSLAGEGEIYSSAVVPMLVEGDAFNFEEREPVTLKGIQAPRVTYQLIEG